MVVAKQVLSSHRGEDSTGLAANLFAEGKR